MSLDHYLEAFIDRNEERVLSLGAENVDFFSYLDPVVERAATKKKENHYLSIRP